MQKTRFSATFRVDKNIIEVPLPYHRQWRPYYPTYVLFDYNGSKHFVRVWKYGTRYFFAHGLKEFRRAHDINDNVIIRFFAPSKNTSFDVDVMGPIHRQSRGRSVVTTRRHVFTTDDTQDMMQHNFPLVLPAVASNFLFGSKKYIHVQHGYGRRNQWQITIHDGLTNIHGKSYLGKKSYGMKTFPVEDHTHSQ
ncbi:hypothetical protein AAZV13_08G255700 [Glycine max]